MTMFDDWLAKAKAGESYTYAEGYLPRSRTVTWAPVKGNTADEAAHRQEWWRQRA